MVLTILCKDDKIFEKKLSELYLCKCTPKHYCHIQFFWAKDPSDMLGKLPSLSVTYQLIFVLLKGHLVFWEDRKQTLAAPWARIAFVIWHYHVLNVFISRD